MAEQFADPTHDGKAEPQAETALACRISELMVLLENGLKLSRWDADARIPHLQANFVAIATAAEQNLAPLGVFDCVGEQVADHLREQQRIASHPQAAGNNVQG